MHPGVVPAALGLGQQEVLLSRLPGEQQGLTGVALSVVQGLGERLVTRLRQKENANDANEGAAGENDVVKEIALLIVQLHDRGSEHAETSAGQYQAQTTTPNGNNNNVRNVCPILWDQFKKHLKTLTFI